MTQEDMTRLEDIATRTKESNELYQSDKEDIAWLISKISEVTRGVAELQQQCHFLRMALKVTL